MTYLAKPKLHHPKLPTNALGFTHRDYEGAVSTLCAGCGHDSISAAIIQACFELDLEPHRVAKLSGHRLLVEDARPTSSATAHGFNSVHGRMPSVLTGANLANRDLIYLGVSGDGDSASIGLGQFAHCHAPRRQHGLHRREQRRLRPDQGPVLGHRRPRLARASAGAVNDDAPIDLVGMALLLGASFVARSFSGDKTQLVPLIKAAIRHHGAAFIDVVSPCVAFNNHAGLDQELRLCPRAQRGREPPRRHGRRARRSPPTTRRARSRRSRSTTAPSSACASSPPTTTRTTASPPSTYLQERHAAGEIVTGLLYIDPEPRDLHDQLGTVDTPLNRLTEAELCPGSAGLDAFNAARR